MQVVGLSGGKDSTAMALRMAELGEDFVNLFNPTGDEFDDLLDHIARIVTMTGKRLHVTNPGFSLAERIRHYESTPSHRMRWCTRELKLEPTKAFLLARPGSTLCISIRADEDYREGAASFYGENVNYRMPFVEWGWGIDQVTGYIEARGVKIPRRTDCALCYDKRLSEWYALWHDYPDRWIEGEVLEELTGHSFRSPTAGKFPHTMKGMRAAFEAGRLPRGMVPLPLFDDYDEKTSKNRQRCRICSM